ncbi:hypothetical protein HWV62_30284 [Athelia sp. TMB]|nr:hypothetical protein HWV62_30284 [Athelia sp. TMB]
MPRVGKSRSAAQRLHSLGAVFNINTKNKENSGAYSNTSGSSSGLGSSFHNSKLANLLEQEKSRANKFKCKLHNVARKLTRSVKNETQSCADAVEARKELSAARAAVEHAQEANERLKRDKNALRMRRDRAPDQLERAVE